MSPVSIRINLKFHLTLDKGKHNYAYLYSILNNYFCIIAFSTDCDASKIFTDKKSLASGLLKISNPLSGSIIPLFELINRNKNIHISDCLKKSILRDFSDGICFGCNISF